MIAKELQSLIRSNEIPTVILLLGSSAYVKQKLLRNIVGAILPPSMEDFNYNVFDQKNMDIRDIYDISMQFPMMSEKRVVMVDDYNWSSLADNELNILEDLLSNIPDTTCLIFKQDLNAFPKKGNAKKAYSLFEKYASICTADKLAGTELYNWLTSQAKKMNCVLSRSMAEYLVSQAGDEENLLSNELNKICNYVKEGEITRSHIDNLATKTLETKIYYLTDNLISGNFDKAFETYNILVKQKTEPEYLLGIIANSFIEMYRVKLAGVYKHSNTELAQVFDYKGREFVLNKASKNVRNYSVNQLHNAIKYLSEADTKLKTARDNAYLIIEQLMVKLTLIRNK